jgi:HEAT repeat protein
LFVDGGKSLRDPAFEVPTMRRLLALVVGWGIVAVSPAADVAELVKKLKNKDVETRRAAAQALTESGAKDAVAPLTEALKDNDAFVRRYAAQALAAAGPEAKPAVANLGLMLMGEKERREGQFAAAVALAKIGAPSLPTLNLALRHPALDRAARKKVIDILAEMGPEAKEALPNLVDEFLARKPPPGRTPLMEEDKIELAAAMGKIAGADDKTVIAALETITKNEKINDNNRLKKAAADALKKITERKWDPDSSVRAGGEGEPTNPRSFDVQVWESSLYKNCTGSQRAARWRTGMVQWAAG